MPAIGWLLASGALNALDKRDAARAEAAKAKAATEAEVALYKKKKNIDAEIAKSAAADEAKQKSLDHVKAWSEAAGTANYLESLDPTKKYIVNPRNYEFITVDMNEGGFPKEKVTSIVTDMNAELKSSGITNQKYVSTASQKNPNLYTWTLMEVEPGPKTTEQIQQEIDTATDVAGAGMDVTITTKFGDTTLTQKTPTKKDDVVDPTKFSTKYGGDPIAFGPQFFAQVGTGLTQKQVAEQKPIVFDLTPSGNLPIFPPADNPQVQNDYTPNVDFLVYNPSTVSGQTPSANERLRSFFTTFTPERLKKIVAQKNTNPQTYKQTARLLQTLSYDWTQATQLKTNEFIKLDSPTSVFREDLEVLKNDVKDLGLVQALDRGFNQALGQANTENDLPTRTPPALDTDTGALLSRARPTISNSSLVVRDANGTVQDFSPDFERVLQRGTANGQVPADTLLSIIELGVVPGQVNQAGVPVPSPEGAVRAAKGIDDLTSLFASLFPQQMVMDASFAIPGFTAQQKQTVRSALSSFATLEDQLTALKASLPSHVVSKFNANGMVTRGSTAEAVYNLVAGGEKFITLAEQTNNARKTVDTTQTVRGLLLEGAQPGFIGEVARFREAVNYFTKEVTDEAGRVFNNNLGFEEATTIDGRSYSANNTIVASLNEELNTIDAMTNEQMRKNALLKFHLRVLSYTYAAMLDPNGRLSDADREAADAAIGISLISTPAQILPVVEEIEKRANYNFVRGSSYTSGNALQAYSMKLYDSNVTGVPVRTATQVIDAYFVQQGEPQPTGAAGADESSRQELLNQLGGTPVQPQQPATPGQPIATPAPVVPAQNQNTPFPVY